MAKILVIDDETQIRRLLRMALEGEGHSVRDAGSGEEGLQWLKEEAFDLILLDLVLPGMSGSEILGRVRGSSNTPVVVLSVIDSDDQIVALLEKGADDYVIKPFHMGQLLARVRVALRHGSQIAQGEKYAGGEIMVDFLKRTVEIRGIQVKLTPTEFTLLRHLIRNEGKVITHEELMREVWGPVHQNESNNLRVYINSLRKKIEKDPAHPVHLINEPYVGYRFVNGET